VLLYGMERWTLKVSTMNKLQAFEMWVCRRVLLRIPWTARRTNDEVLRIINKDRELLDTIKRRKTAYLGHVICEERYQFLQLIIGEKIAEREESAGNRCHGSATLGSGLRTMQELMHTIRNREEWTNMIANIH